MEGMQSAALLACATVLAFAAGGAIGKEAVGRVESARRRRSALARAGAESGLRDGRAFPLRYAADLSARLRLGSVAAMPGARMLGRVRAWYARRATKAGLVEDVSEEGFVEATGRLGVGGACIGLLIGCSLSNEMAVACGAFGAVLGASSPLRAVGRACRERSDRLERSLSEMLEVVALGVRSGLSFDRSFQLYGQHFDSAFARECASAHRSWTLGLATRESALRSLAECYESPLLERVVSSMVRSLRFGSSVAESLESAAGEARAEHRARVGERVAKAPVKMMVPTGTLILPAMLLLVLGPVLLELMEGF